MAHQPQLPSRKVADQVLEIAQAVKQDSAQRQKVSAERREQDAAVDAWFSRKRAVLISLIVTVPIFAVILAANITGQSLLDLATPDPPAPVAQKTAQQELDGVVKRVEAFKTDYNQLPASLIEVGTSPKGDWSYTKQTGGQYTIAVKMYGQTLSYDSRQQKAGL